MKNEWIASSTVNGIHTISLNRPEKRNAMNAVLIHQLRMSLKKAKDDSNIRIVLLKGEGEHFCAGADIAWMQSIAVGDKAVNDEDAQSLADLMYELYTFPKPTIALAHGMTMGGGLGLLAAADIAIATDNAHFAFSEVKMGLVPSVISPYIIAAIGERAARYYFLTGERFAAQEALTLQLVHQLTTPTELLTKATEIAKQLLQNNSHAMAEAKQLIRYVSREKIAEPLVQKTAEHLANLRSSKEAQEGLNAFIQKRKPNWLPAGS